MIPASELSSRVSSMLQGYEGQKKELLSSCSKKDRPYIEKNIGIFQEVKKFHTEELKQLVAATEDNGRTLKSLAVGQSNRIFLDTLKREAEKKLNWKERLSLKWSLSGKRRFWIFGEKTDSYYTTLAEKAGECIKKNVGIFQALETAHSEELMRLTAAAKGNRTLNLFAVDQSNRIFLDTLKREAGKKLDWKERLSLKWSLSGKRRFWIFGGKTDSYYATLAKKSGERALRFFQTLDKSSWRAKCDERANGYLLIGKTPPAYLIKGYIPPGRPALAGAKPDEITWVSSSEVPKKLREALTRGYLLPSKEEIAEITAPPKWATRQLLISIPHGKKLTEQEELQVRLARTVKDLPKKVLKWSELNIYSLPLDPMDREIYAEGFQGMEIRPTQIYLSKAPSSYRPNRESIEVFCASAAFQNCIAAITAPPKWAKYQLSFRVDDQNLSKDELEQMRRAKTVEDLPKKVLEWPKGSLQHVPVDPSARETFFGGWPQSVRIISTQIYLSRTASKGRGLIVGKPLVKDIRKELEEAALPKEESTASTTVTENRSEPAYA